MGALVAGGSIFKGYDEFFRMVGQFLPELENCKGFEGLGQAKRCGVNRCVSPLGNDKGVYDESGKQT